MKIKIAHKYECDGIHRDKYRTRDSKIFLSQSEGKKYQATDIKDYSNTIIKILILESPLLKINISKCQENTSKYEISKELILHKNKNKTFLHDIGLLGIAKRIFSCLFMVFYTIIII